MRLWRQRSPVDRAAGSLIEEAYWKHRPRPSEPVDVLADYPDELSYRDLMRLFRVKYKGTIYIWLEQGHIPGSFVGGRWIVHKWQLRERLDETSNQTSPPGE